MTAFHMYLGISVVVLNAAAGVLGLVRPDGSERFWSLAGLAHGALGLQVVAGFFLLTSTGAGPGVLHILLPALSLGAAILARTMTEPGTTKTRAVALASLAVVAVGIYAYLTGIGHPE